MNNGPESAQISMASDTAVAPSSPSSSPYHHDSVASAKTDRPPEKPVKRRRNVNKIHLQQQQQQQAAAAAAQHHLQQQQQLQQQQHHHHQQNLAFSPYQLPPGAALTETGQVVMTPGGGFPFGMYGGGGGPMSQFHAASLYNNLLMSAAAANGMVMPPGMAMGRFVAGRRPEPAAAMPEQPPRGGPPVEAPPVRQHMKRESPSPSSGSDRPPVSHSHSDEPQG